MKKLDPITNLARLTKGEGALIQTALRYFIHEQHVMIQQAHKECIKDNKHGKELGRVIFEDHKKHHEDAIKAAGELLDKFVNRTIYTEDGK